MNIKYLLSSLFIFISFVVFSQTRYWVSGGAASWSGDNWANSSGGAPDGGGPPSGAENARFDANGLGNCTVDAAASFSGIYINGYNGIIDINGNSFSCSGSIDLYSGTINDGPATSSFQINTTSTARFQGVTIGSNLNCVADGVLLNGSIFNNNASFYKTGNGNNYGSGGNTFNGVFLLDNSGNGGSIRLGNNSPDDFNGNVTFINSGAGTTHIGYNNAGHTIDGNITLESSSGNGIQFGAGGGTITIGSGFSINIGGGGFSSGNLILRGIIQSGTTAQSIAITGTGYIQSYDSQWGGNISFTGERVFTRGSTYNGTATFTKNGAGNDRSDGGNTFNDDVTINHSGENQFMFGELVSDNFNSSVDINNSGTGTVYLGHNGGSNSITGNLTINATANAGNVFIATQAGASLTVGGNCTLSNTSVDNTSLYIGDNGDLTVNGNLIVNNNGSGSNSLVYLADGATSTCQINGTTTINSAGGTSNSRVYLGNNGDVTFNGDLTINISTGANNSQVYLNNGSNSSNSYNQNIILSNSNTGGDGVYFGNSGGSGVLASGKTITIGGSGFVAGQLYLRNFTQTGVTAQSVTLTGTAQFYSYESNWEGALTVSSPQIEFRGSNFTGAVNFTKTGVGNDYCYGGNSFASDVSITNNGSNEIRMGITNPDIFSGNLTIENSGSGLFRFAHGSLGNTIAGNFTAINSGSSNNSNLLICNDSASSLTISGTSIFTNSSSNVGYIYLGQNGDITFNNDVTITNSATGATGNIYLTNGEFSELTFNGNLTINSTGSSTNLNSYIGNSGLITISGNLIANNNNSATNSEFNISNGQTASVSVAGNVTILNNGLGTNKGIYLGDDGDIIVSGTTSITNSSSATNSYIRVNYNSNSSGTFSDNITLEANADNDEISFGDREGNSTLAATKTISIVGGGFLGGDLVFRNFTQTGNTAQSFNISGNGYLENYDSNWGGNISFTASRILTRGTTYQGTANFSKTGSGDDRSSGGNTFTNDVTISNSGDNSLSMGNGAADSFTGNLTLNNTGDGSDIELAYNSAGNTITGNLLVNNNPSGGSCTFLLSRNSSSTLSISGTTTINNGGTPSSASNNLGYDGSVTFGDDVFITNSITSGSLNAYLAQRSTSSVIINGNFQGINSGSGTDERIYLGDDGDISLNGTLLFTNNSSSNTSEMYIADGTTSTVTISNNATCTNNGSGTNSRFYFGNSGNVTFNGDLFITNSSGATNSEIRLNHSSSSSNTYNGNIVLENTNIAGDGIRFGENGGTGVLALGQTLTIGANGFNGGDLQFRNFTRTGATTTNLTCTGSARIYSYDSFWNGDVSFTAPRILTLGTSYAGETTFEKTGSGDDASAGGNTFSGNLTATNSGSSYLMFGNGTLDTFNGNITLNNTGSDEIYLAYNGLGHIINGNLAINNLGSSGNTYIVVSDRNGASLNVTGNVTINNNGSSSNNTVRLCDDGVLTIGGDLSIVNSGTATTNDVYVSTENNSTTTITGNTTLTNSGGGTNGRIFFGRYGDITLNGSFSSTNTSTANNADLRFGEGSNSELTFNGTASFTNSGTGTTSYYYIGNQGDITFNSALTVSNTSGAANSELRLNYSGNSVNNYNASVIVENTNANGDGVSFGRNGGAGTLASGQTITIGGGGYVAGDLHLRNFTQLGAKAQTLTLTGTARFYPYTSTFNANFTLTAPEIYLRESVFQGTATLTKTGNSNINSYGGNTFNSDLDFTVSGAGFYGFSNNSANDYNSNVTLNQLSSGYIRPSYNRDCTFSGNLNLNLTTVTRFGDAAGSIIFDGSGNQSINDLGPGVEHIFEEMVINKSGGELTINTPITVQGSITFTNGIVNTTTTNTITLTDNSAALSASSSSHIVGPVNKIGNDDFTFPVGNGTLYRPIGVSRVNNNSSEFQATYFSSNPGLSFDLNSKDGNLDHISSRDFWILDRVTGSAAAEVVLSWDDKSEVSTASINDLRVSRWDGSQWVSEGIGTATGDTTGGTINSSSGRVSSFSPFALGSSTSSNPLPVELASFSASCHNGKVEFNWTTFSELNNDFFELLVSEDGNEFYNLTNINGKGTTNEVTNYTKDLQVDFLSNEKLFFKLRQNDFDGKTSDSEIISVSSCLSSSIEVNAYPNPVTNNVIYVNGNDFEELSYKIYSVTGELIESDNVTKQGKIQLKNLPFGVYVFQWESENYIKKERIIIQ